MEHPIFFIHDDSRILESIRKGDESVLMELFHKNLRSIGSLVARTRGTEADAQDVLQESLIILWERVHNNSFRYEAKLSTFLYGTAKRIWYHRLHKKGRETYLDEHADNVPSEDFTPLEELEDNERIGAVRDAMEKIGQPCRRLLLMFYWEEASMETIAGQLGFANAETAKAKKYQCKKALEKMVKAVLEYIP
ncbi:MAG: sigma-70 family RNA polymerase sigma factor [Bacteroidota bacterium]